MSRREEARAKAATGELGALRWALVQRTDDGRANHLLIIMSSRGNESFESYMSVANLARETECGERTVKRKLRYLLLRGFVADISNLYPERRTKTYRLCAPAAPC